MSVTIISVGSGGFNIASELREAGIFLNARFIVCDTDAADLKAHSTSADKTFLLEKLRCTARSSYSHLVKHVVDATTDEIILCVALGGKTGSRYAPLIAFAATLRQDKHKEVYSVFSTPDNYEEEKVQYRVKPAYAQLNLMSKVSFIQDNSRLKEIIGESASEAINKPLVETFVTLLRKHATLKQLAGACFDANDTQDLVPETYQADEEDPELIEIICGFLYTLFLSTNQQETGFDRLAHG